MKIGVLTDAETASGFRMAGLEALVASPEEAAGKLAQMVQSNRYALIAVDERLLKDPNKAVERVMRGRNAPVLLSLPNLLDTFGGGGDAKAYMRRLVRETIGFDIKL
ncbi:V-type ATP synthase subunit F [Meiothermus luteus]|jgi:V/A-type H+-transporting ATPase subunit F|uniref:V-type ATP synthase subunit F n=1 Tax=Meiothermus luteus TaxID=2026184 RepID=A0A399EKA3_9DEIN|nr:V-type ATP synthase subunit F [Meiothermus luteus]RIH83780.1 V-type ATP synthase subunit F [Meiothermus luteus]RMH58557.1 MAG: V-type ATP synthase subunit F [Deinococcota bacterium]